jgi:hypothetical protein
MQKIKVVRAESKPTPKGGTVVAIYDDKNTRFSGFLKELQDVQEGDIIEADIQVDGKYNNIVALGKIIKSGTDTKPEQPVVTTNTLTAKDRSIEEQVATKNGIDLLVAKVIDLNHPLAKASIRWSLSRLGCMATEVKSPPSEIKVGKTGPDEIFNKPKKVFKDVEDLKKAMYDKYQLTAQQVADEYPDVASLAKEKKFTEAWELLEKNIAKLK